MPAKQRGFTLMIVLTVLMVLSLVVMATFEQAQWVKRSSYLVWQQVKMQDRMWQQLVLAEEQLGRQAATQKCLAQYSLTNAYFFENKNPPTDCLYKLDELQMGVAYERIARDPCGQIRDSVAIGVDFFRITIQGLLSASGQKMVLQSIVAVSAMGKNETNLSPENNLCAKKNQYQSGRQSWLLQ